MVYKMDISDALFLEHDEHRAWLRSLNYYQDEIKFLQTDLMEVLYKNMDSHAICERVQEYRRIMLATLKHIDHLRYEVLVHEKRFMSACTESENAHFFDHGAVRNHIDGFIHDLEITKKQLRQFVANNR